MRRRNPLTSHELRDADGYLLAVLDLLEPDRSALPDLDHGMIELAADIAGSSIRVRIFPPKCAATLAAA
jgi:hypothetical protein